MGMAIPQLKRKWIVMAALLIALAVLPVSGVPQAWMLYIFLYFVYLASANMWNLLCGYSGLISLCQPAFIGIAGYTMAILTWIGVPFYVGILAGAVLAGVFAVVISIPVFRLSGIYFAVGTLVVPEALRIWFLLWRPVGGALHGGGAGYMVKELGGLTMTHYYWMALIIGAASIVLMRIILSSKLGLALAAIRDNQRAAAGSGMNVFRLKLYSFVISAVITGIAGALFYVYQGYIEPSSSFSIQWTMTIILATVIGGIKIEEGPIVGTAVVVFLLFVLAKYPGISLFIQGAILVCLMLIAPQGIMGTLRKYKWYQSLARFAGFQEPESPEKAPEHETPPFRMDSIDAGFAGFQELQSPEPAHEQKATANHMVNTEQNIRRTIMSEELVNALAELKAEESEEIVRRRLDAGDDPNTILKEARQAMEIVGKRFEDGTYYIPELVFSGEILKAISEMIKPKLTKEGETERLGKFIIGTVKGDIHDIGKNIVTFMLDVNGVEVHDLGIDVPVEKFIEKIKETNAPVVGLSGFLTVAFDTMKETVDAIKEAGLRDKVKIIIGGGNMNEEIKNYVGADSYGVDAMAAVTFAKEVFRSADLKHFEFGREDLKKDANRVRQNLEAWCSPPLEFPTKEIEQAYQQRARRIADAILLKKPDRVPAVPMWEFFYATYAGYSCKDIMYDPQKAEDSVVKTVSELQPDGFQGPIFHMTGPIYDAYASKDVIWPGHGLPTNQAHQFVEGEYMKADEYEVFLNDPTDFILRYYLPRVSGNLGALATTTAIRNCFAYFMQFGGWASFGTPEGLAALETLKNLSKASFEYVQWLVATIGKVVMMGYPPWSGSLAEAPFDIVGDTLRGTKGIMLDMFRQPDVLKAACEKLVPIMAEYTIAGARASGNHPIVFIPLHKGTAATRDGKGGFMSLEQFEEFYWPTLRKLMLTLIDNGLVPNLLVEGDYTSRLEIIADVPPGTCIYHFEHIDIHKAKKILGDKVCIRGCIPIHYMTVGTPDDVRKAAKEQIDVLGEGGGYMIDTTMASEQVKPENMRAMIEFTKEYGVYK